MRFAGAAFAIIALAAVVLIGWNLSRFIGARPVVVTKELAFLPGPTTARVLALGQGATAAKLRWIDSFRFQQLIFDRKDDRLADGSSVFVRLFDTLIPLDPHYLHFYQSAAVNLGGILDRHGEELRYLQLGLHHLPREIALHRQRASVLHTFYRWEETQPESLDAVLAEWADLAPDANQRQQVYVWKAAMARRVFHGLEQVPYWLDQLRQLGPGPNADYARDTLYEQLTGFGGRLIAGAWIVGLPTEQDDRWQALAPRIVAALAALPADRQPPSWLTPVERTADGWRLRHDPWGLPWFRQPDGSIEAAGRIRQEFERRVAATNLGIAEAARKAGRWPTRIDELASMGVPVPAPLPAGGELSLRGQGLAVTWTAPPAAPWPLERR